MTINAEATWRTLATRAGLLAIGLVGLIFIVVTEVPTARAYGWDHTLATVIGHIGIALVVASVLGLTVDWTIRAGLVSDAVHAALGYLLPEQLKPELAWLYDQKIMVQQTYDVRLEHSPEDNTVRFCGRYHRRFRNVSETRTKVSIGGGSDEWFHPKGETIIDACEYRRIRNGEPGPTEQITLKRGALGIGYEVGDVSIDPDEIIDLTMSYSMWRPEHGYEFLVHRHLIDRPTVNIEVPASLVAFVTFAHRSNYSESEYQSGKFSKTLERVLLPHQEIRICWHVRSTVEKRASLLSG